MAAVLAAVCAVPAFAQDGKMMMKDWTITSSSPDSEKTAYIWKSPDLLNAGDRYELGDMLFKATPAVQRVLTHIVATSKTAELAVGWNGGMSGGTTHDKMMDMDNVDKSDYRALDEIYHSLDSSDRSIFQIWWNNATWTDQLLIVKIWKGGLLRGVHAHYYNNF